MLTVAVVGAGDIGGATAHALAAADCVGRILLVDPAARVAAGKALDIQQAGAVEGFHTVLSGTDDLSRTIGCHVCVVADVFGTESREWQGDEGLAMVSRLASMLGTTPLVFAGAGHAPLIRAAYVESAVARGRLLGSAPEALAGAIRAMVALEARCSPTEVGAAVLGLPPKGLVVPWGEATIGGSALTQILDPVQLARIEARVARLWPPGPYALGQAAASIVKAVVTASRRATSVFAVLDGEFGIRRQVGIVPALLSSGGLEAPRIPALPARERVLLETALNARL